ncbi:hypothetical protein C1Y63_04760 [Corynebacterium sp. 13CS0277]|uniref:phage capsid protein n=1 Tax=Corynebacterium sp. 13CS0277 TaxID=2071994 RepID=UPI000D0303A9|nr:phage capsid protein [Corynebacterium sp. 13CS0277]PRQ11722.1 hypothetical protein C1Y63_04760 [Corynebacterium sp. 13CS0277]
MAITTAGITPFIPEVWAAALMEPFEKSLVYGQASIVNSTYSGQVAQVGDTVHVGQIGAPTVRAYDANADLEIEDLTVTDATLTVDQGQYFAFRVEDVSALQAAGPLKDPATRQASIALRDGVDRYLAGVLKKDAKTKLGAVKVVDDDPQRVGEGQQSAYKTLVKMAAALNQESVPTDGRFCVVGSGFYSALMMDPRFTRVDGSGTTEGLRNGIVGRALGMDILVSNNVPVNGKKETIIAGVPQAVTFVNQITRVETTREEKRFADIVKGLMVYGAKAFRPEGLVTVDAEIVEPA